MTPPVKRGRPLANPESGHRVSLYAGGPMVRPDTRAVLQEWRRCYRVSMGQAIDQLLDFARANPEVFRLKVKRTIMQQENTKQ